MNLNCSIVECQPIQACPPAPLSVPWNAPLHPGTMGEAGVGHGWHLWQGERRVGQCDPPQSHPKVNIKEGGDEITRWRFPKKHARDQTPRPTIEERRARWIEEEEWEWAEIERLFGMEEKKEEVEEGEDKNIVA